MGLEFFKEGAIAHVSAQSPLLLSDTRRVWYVERGTVELFIIPILHGQPSGLRQHACSLSAGQIFFGMPHQAIGEAVGVLAVVDHATQLRVLDVARLRELGGDFQSELRALVQGWIETLAYALGDAAATIKAPLLDDDPASPAKLDRFHRAVLDALLAKLQNEEIYERARIEAKVDDDASRLEETLLGLADLTRTRSTAIDPHKDSVASACLFIARQLGVESDPLLVSNEALASERLQRYARALRLRVRRVLLEPGWWEKDNQPLLGFIGEDAVAMVRRGDGYDLFDPATRKTRRLTADEAQKLDLFAFSFYRTLPGQALRRRDLLSFALFDTRRDLFTAVLLGLIGGLFGTVLPLATGQIFDSIVPSADRGLLFQTLLLMLGLAFGGVLLSISQAVATVRAQTKMSASLQAAIWDRLLSLPVTFFKSYTSGDLAARAMAIENIRQLLSGAVLSSVLSALFALWYLAILFYYDVRLALYAIVLVLPPLLLSVVDTLIQLPLQRRIAERRGNLTGFLLQLFHGIAKIRVAGLEEKAFCLWAEDFGEIRALEVRSMLIELGFGMIRGIYPATATAIIFYLVADELGPTFSTGEFIAFFAAFGIFMGALGALFDNSLLLISSIPAWERAVPIMDTELEVHEQKEQSGLLRGAIEVSQLSFRYQPEQPMVIDQISFRCEPGELVAIVGASGCGKSTLLRLLLGFEKPATGAIYYDGQSLSKLDVLEVRRQLGVVLQNGQLLSGSILENIAGAHVLTNEDVWRALERSGLKADVEAMPMGIQTMVSHGGTTLSGGQRQRLMIARAIVTEPRILLFDEATSALDNQTQAQVSKSLEELKVTRIVIAHRLSTIQNADRILVMDRGRIVQEGRFAELMAQEGLFRNLAQRQLA